jgi:multidrug efflux pump subunit AcrA (membrane-fusion protein)
MSRITGQAYKYLVPLLAICGFIFAVYSVLSAQQEPPTQPPLSAPAKSPYEKVVAGSGITEARTENISIGAAVPGLTAEVYVKVGEYVTPGQPLFRIDDRALRADLKVRQAMLNGMQAQLNRLENMPRKEEVTPSEYRIAEAQARVVETLDRYQRAERLIGKGAISDEEFTKSKQDHAMADKILKQLEAQHALLLAGAWGEDKQVAQANVAQEEAQVEKIKTELDRLEVRAPHTMDVERFKVLQVNVRPGEFVGAPASQALIVLGDIDHLHVRVDIDEYDIPRFSPTAKATAKLRGDPSLEFPLKFVRVEPYVIPKRSLTGDNTERVDTRVLQVIYALEKEHDAVFVGQQMDVFIESK